MTYCFETPVIRVTDNARTKAVLDVFETVLKQSGMYEDSHLTPGAIQNKVGFWESVKRFFGADNTRYQEIGRQTHEVHAYLKEIIRTYLADLQKILEVDFAFAKHKKNAIEVSELIGKDIVINYRILIYRILRNLFISALSNEFQLQDALNGENRSFKCMRLFIDELCSYKCRDAGIFTNKKHTINYPLGQELGHFDTHEQWMRVLENAIAINRTGEAPKILFSAVCVTITKLQSVILSHIMLSLDVILPQTEKVNTDADLNVEQILYGIERCEVAILKKNSLAVNLNLAESIQRLHQSCANTPNRITLDGILDRQDSIKTALKTCWHIEDSDQRMENIKGLYDLLYKVCVLSNAVDKMSMLIDFFGCIPIMTGQVNCRILSKAINTFLNYCRLVLSRCEPEDSRILAVTGRNIAGGALVQHSQIRIISNLQKASDNLSVLSTRVYKDRVTQLLTCIRYSCVDAEDSLKRVGLITREDYLIDPRLNTLESSIGIIKTSSSSAAGIACLDETLGHKSRITGIPLLSSFHGAHFGARAFSCSLAPSGPLIMSTKGGGSCVSLSDMPFPSTMFTCAQQQSDSAAIRVMDLSQSTMISTVQPGSSSPLALPISLVSSSSASSSASTVMIPEAEQNAIFPASSLSSSITQVVSIPLNPIAQQLARKLVINDNVFKARHVFQQLLVANANIYIDQNNDCIEKSFIDNHDGTYSLTYILFFGVQPELDKNKALLQQAYPKILVIDKPVPDKDGCFEVTLRLNHAAITELLVGLSNLHELFEDKILCPLAGLFNDTKHCIQEFITKLIEGSSIEQTEENIVKYILKYNGSTEQNSPQLNVPLIHSHDYSLSFYLPFENEPEFNRFMRYCKEKHNGLVIGSAYGPNTAGLSKIDMSVRFFAELVNSYIIENSSPQPSA